LQLLHLPDRDLEPTWNCGKRVPIRRRPRGVPKQLLRRPQIARGGVHGRAEGMPQVSRISSCLGAIYSALLTTVS
jgi:hypothetical protein